MELEANASWDSGRLKLFVLRPDDVSARYVEWLNDPLINRFLESRYVTHTEESTRAFVSATLAHPDVLFLGIGLLEGGVIRHVGNIKLEINRRYGVGEIGILIGERDAHGRGIATEAISMLVHIARERLRLRKLTAGCYGTNVGSERAFIKAGFVVEGRRPAQYLLDDEPEDLVLLGRVL